MRPTLGQIPPPPLAEKSPPSPPWQTNPPLPPFGKGGLGGFWQRGAEGGFRRAGGLSEKHWFLTGKAEGAVQPADQVPRITGIPETVLYVADIDRADGNLSELANADIWSR